MIIALIRGEDGESYVGGLDAQFADSGC
jgi:hypothetical protein